MNSTVRQEHTWFYARMLLPVTALFKQQIAQAFVIGPVGTSSVSVLPAMMLATSTGLGVTDGVNRDSVAKRTETELVPTVLPSRNRLHSP